MERQRANGGEMQGPPGKGTDGRDGPEQVREQRRVAESEVVLDGVERATLDRAPASFSEDRPVRAGPTAQHGPIGEREQVDVQHDEQRGRHHPEHRTG